jgi:hypothetical protein
MAGQLGPLPYGEDQPFNVIGLQIALGYAVTTVVTLCRER